jgi:hypothetical protein
MTRCQKRVDIDGGGGAGDARGVDQHPGHPEGPLDLREGTGDGGRGGDVDGGPDDIDAGALGEVGRARLDLGQQVQQRDARPLPGERRGHRQAEPARAPGDHRNRAVKVLEHQPSLGSSPQVQSRGVQCRAMVSTARSAPRM